MQPLVDTAVADFAGLPSRGTGEFVFPGLVGRLESPYRTLTMRGNEYVTEPAYQNYVFTRSATVLPVS